MTARVDGGRIKEAAWAIVFGMRQKGHMQGVTRSINYLTRSDDVTGEVLCGPSPVS
jgi:hypothetical protein